MMAINFVEVLPYNINLTTYDDSIFSSTAVIVGEMTYTTKLFMAANRDKCKICCYHGNNVMRVYGGAANSSSVIAWKFATTASGTSNTYGVKEVSSGGEFLFIYTDTSGYRNGMPIFANEAECLNYLGARVEKPITYIPINSTLSGPESVSSGDSVSVDVSFPDGYIYRETGISVYDTNGAIAHSYDPTTGKLTFTMP